MHIGMMYVCMYTDARYHFRKEERREKTNVLGFPGRVDLYGMVPL